MRKLVLIPIWIVLFIAGAATAAAQTYAVAVNAADALDLGTIGVEGSVAVGQHWSIVAGFRVNPWSFGKHDTWNGLFSEPDMEQKQDRKQVYAVGARWWPWNVYSGWWIGGKAQYQEFNRGGLRLPIGVGNDGVRVGDGSIGAEEGDAFGAVLSGGYSLMLREHWNLDFGLGVWGGWTKYRKFAAPENGKLIGEGGKWFFVPNEVILSIVYVF